MNQAASFKVSKDDAVLLAKIVSRAVNENVVDGSNTLDLSMDLTACHANGTPLKLEELLRAPDFDFAHDILGIQRHINRTTGVIMDCFLPRFAQPEGKPRG